MTIADPRRPRRQGGHSDRRLHRVRTLPAKQSILDRDPLLVEGVDDRFNVIDAPSPNSTTSLDKRGPEARLIVFFWAPSCTLALKIASAMSCGLSSTPTCSRSLTDGIWGVAPFLLLRQPCHKFRIIHRIASSFRMIGNSEAISNSGTIEHCFSVAKCARLFVSL